jgi:hypothetical protein
MQLSAGQKEVTLSPVVTRHLQSKPCSTVDEFYKKRCQGKKFSLDRNVEIISRVFRADSRKDGAAFLNFGSYGLRWSGTTTDPPEELFFARGKLKLRR